MIIEDIEYIIAESKKDYWIDKLPKGKQWIHVLPDIICIKDLNLENEIMNNFDDKTDSRYN